RDVFVGEAVKAVTPDAGIVKLGGQGEPLRKVRRRSMKRGVEAGHLRKIGPTVEQQPDRGEIVRLMQRCERRESLELVGEVALDARGRGVRVAAVHHTMTDAEQSVVAETAL